MNSGKTPTGKALQGTIGFTTNKQNKVIINMPRPWFPKVKNQIKVPLGIEFSKDNQGLIQRAIDRLQIALEDGKLHNPDGSFNKYEYQEVLSHLKIFPILRGVMKVIEGGKGQPPIKPELSLLEIWDKYCEYRKSSLAISTYEVHYKVRYVRFINSALNAVGDNPLEIRNWLVANRNLKDVKNIISLLEKAYNFAIQHNLYFSVNPYLGLTDDIESNNKNKEIKQDEYKSNDDDYLNKSKAFTWNEVEIILDFLKNDKGRFKRWYHFTAFRFLTGCRLGEVSGLFWGDIKWDKECIVFNRAYVSEIKKFKSTKNNTTRIFPMLKNGRLWNLLKELKQGEPNECVFAGKNNKAFSPNLINKYWNYCNTKRKTNPLGYDGFITILVKQGKLKKYLPPYNTRHTFITHCIYDLNIPSDVVNTWCEHSDEVSRKHYRDTSEYIKQFNPDMQFVADKPNNEINELKELIKMQQAQIDLLLKKQQD
ncbi:MAG: tyrosine-type recombinase/integrase [Rivularia sp. T60_A2020_040]|nr:tyrosine-type recombinase/integrase [Rivularia sp. T60_A2020_040]